MTPRSTPCAALILRRFWPALMALLPTLLGIALMPGTASAYASPSAQHEHVCTDDVRCHPASVAMSTTERDPPGSVSTDITTYDAVDRWPRGPSERTEADTPSADTIDDPRTLAPVAGVMVTTQTEAQRSDEALSAPAHGRVAAKPAVGFAEGLGHTALTPGRLQHGTKNLTKAGVLPAWSGKTSPGIIERAFTPILEHPTATFNHTLGGTRVRGFLGDINGQQVAAFVYKEGPYQGQLASSFVPSANQLKMWGVP